MNGTSILAMAALVVACVVSAFSLFTEKPDREIIIGAPLRRYRKPVLYVLTGLTLVFGGWQIIKADMENRDAEKKRTAERESDGKMIARLQSSVDVGNAKLDEIRLALHIQVGSTGASTGASTETPANPSRGHVVTLSWEANETTGIVGYNLYRSEVRGTSYTRLNSVLISTSSFVDTNLAPGSTYYYVVTAVNSKGMESPRSNEMIATIPVS